MNCKQAQDFILTDYLDGELSQPVKLETGSHLEECETCREFYEKVLMAAAPLRKAPEVRPPETVWLRIQEILGPEKVRRLSLAEQARGWMERLWDMLPRPVVGAAVSFAVILAILVQIPSVRGPETPLGYLEEQLFYLSSGTVVDEPEERTEEPTTGTGLELFL